jgi:hypothetical protein
MGLVIENRGRPARSINAFQMLSRQPTYALATLRLLRASDIISDIRVTVWQKHRAVFARIGAAAKSKANIDADGKVCRQLTQHP